MRCCLCRLLWPALVLADASAHQLALRAVPPPASGAGVAPGAPAEGRPRGAPGAPLRQSLANFCDLQYSLPVSIGGQRLAGILDTGSSGLVVFGKRCRGCGGAAAYDERASDSFVRGRRQRALEYCSGSCQAEEAEEDVTMGPFIARGTTVWTAVSCEMPLLQHAAFNAVLGFAPPGREEKHIHEELDQARALVARYKAAGLAVPEEVSKLEQRWGSDLEVALAQAPLPQALGLQSFSVCLGRVPGSHGYLVWNDTTHALLHGVLRPALVDASSWSISLRGLGLEQRGAPGVPLGCDSGCSALLDTGTSLLGVPGAVYRKLRGALAQMRPSCSDLRTFPDLVFEVGGGTARLPPDAYVGSVDGAGDGLARIGTKHSPCSLLLFDTGGGAAPALVLGMPFFREYYTTFGFAGRSLVLSPAGNACEPGSTDLRRAERPERPVRPRTIDASRIRIPAWARYPQSSEGA